MRKIRSHLKLLRPFTLMAPAVGGFCFGLLGVKDAGLDVVSSLPLLFLSGWLLAMANATSNILNQVFDEDIDSLHPTKRYRPIPNGDISPESALSFAILLLIVTIGTAIYLFGGLYGVSLTVIMFFAWLYNCPPLLMKRRFILSNIAIAAPRGGLGITCAYAAFASPWNPVMYVAMLYFALYVFGTNTMKDFADAPYDKIGGVRNFVTVLGSKKASIIVMGFLYIPFFFLAVAQRFVPISSVSMLPVFLSVVMHCVMIHNPGKTSVEGNSVLWVLFYLQFALMMVLFVAPLLLI